MCDNVNMEVSDNYFSCLQTDAFATGISDSVIFWKLALNFLSDSKQAGVALDGCVTEIRADLVSWSVSAT